MLATVCGRPFLTHLLDQLVVAGVERVVISTGYMADAVAAAIGTSYRGMDIVYSREDEPLGTGGGIRLGVDKLQSNRFLALNGDSFCALNFGEFISFHESKGATVSLALTRVDDCSRFGEVITSEDGTVEQFIEKGASSRPGWINAGIYLLSREFIQGLPANQPISLERDVFPMMVKTGLYGFKGGGKFIDIGTPESYQIAEAFLGISGIAPNTHAERITST